MASDTASLTIMTLGDGLDVVLALIVDDLHKRLVVERAAALQHRARYFKRMVGQIAHQAHRGVGGVGEQFREFGEHAFLHFRGDKLQHVVETGRSHARCVGRWFRRRDR